MNCVKAGYRALAAAIASIMIATPAIAKQARCEISSAEGEHYSGRCDFTSLGGGSFSVSPIGKREFFSPGTVDAPGITDISLEISEGTADVRGLTTFGINARWGNATRSPKDRACWLGDDFSICVYATSPAARSG
jgi:hypothetical protein